MKLVLGIAFLSLMVSSCDESITIGKDQTLVENRTVGDFEKIIIAVPMDAEIHIDAKSKPSIEISGDKSILPNIKTQVLNGTMSINKTNGIDLFSDKEVTAQITVPSLSSIEIHGTSDVTISGNIKTENLQLKIAGAGNIKIDEVNANSILASISGAGDIFVKKGIVASAAYTISGAGNINCLSIVSKDVNAQIRGAGEIQVNASEKLDASVNGGGSILYKGHPKSINSKTTGLGTVESVE